MKKGIVVLIALSTFFWSCTKKEEVTPASFGNASDAKGNATVQAKEFDQEILEAVKDFSPKVSNVTAGTAVVTLGDESLFVEQEGDQVYVTPLSSTGARVTRQSFASKLGDGQFAGVMVNITRSNAKQFVQWISQDEPNPFETLFGEALFNVFTQGPESDTKIDFDLNPNGLPKGAFLLKGKIQAEGNGNGECDQDCGLVREGKKVSIKADAGLFGFYIDNQLYGHTNGVKNIAFLVTNKLSKKDYVYANGVRTYGSDGDTPNSFAWVLGLGKGTGTPPLTGIVIAVAVNKSKTGAVFTLGAFKGLKIK